MPTDNDFFLYPKGDPKPYEPGNRPEPPDLMPGPTEPPPPPDPVRDAPKHWPNKESA